MAGRRPKGRRALKGSHIKSKQRGTKRAAARSQANRVPRIELAKRCQLEEALLEAHTAVELAMEGISKLDDAGRYVLVNPQYAALLGYGPEELIGQSWEVTVHPDDRASVLDTFAHMLAIGKAEAEIRGVKKDGSLIYKHVVIVKPNGPTGKMSGHFCFARDITQRKREEAFLSAEKQALELVAQGVGLSDVLTFICRTIEAHTSPMLCSVMLVTNDGMHLTTAAAPSLPDEYSRAVDGIFIGPTIGSCGSAAYFKKPAIVSDIATHPLWENYAPVALACGLRACWSQPILSSSGDVLGTFAAYYTEPRVPSPVELAVVERASHVAAMAIQHIMMSEALRESEARFQAFMTHSPAVSFIKDAAGRHLYINPTFERLFGVSSSEIRDKTLDGRLSPEVVAQVQANDEKVLTSGQPIEVEETVPTPDGKSQHWLVLKFPLSASSGERLLGGVAVDITARKQAEAALQRAHEELELRVVDRTAALRRSEQRYAGLVNSVDGIILEVNEAYRITFVSRQAERILGYPVEQWLDDPMFWVDHLHPDDRQWAPAYCQNMTKQALNHEFEYRMFASDGNIVWIRDSVSVMRDDDGRVKLSCILLDVTKHKEMVDRLQLTQYAVDQASDQIFVIGSDGYFRDVNESACHRLGYSKEELLTMSVMDIDPDFSLGVWDSFWAEFTKTKRVQLETRHRSKSGEIYPVEVVANYLCHEGQELDYAIVRDITERKRNEAALLESEERFSKAFNESAIGMAIVATDGRWLQVNQALCEIVGYSKAELEASTFQAITHPDDLGAELHRLRQMLSGELRTYQLEKRYIHKKGSLIWIVLNVSLVRNSDETPKHFIAQIQDITERKQLQEQRARYTETLEQQVTQRTAEIAKLESQRAQTERLAALGRLAAGVAHEINNPVAGIKNAFALVKQAVDPAHPQYEFVGMIDREIGRVSSIVQNMYQLYGRESSKVDKIDLGTMIADIEALFAKQLQQRQLRLVVESDLRFERLDAPRSDLLQVLLNLLNNAIDCSREGGTITMTIREEAEVIRIALADQGSGISPEILPHIFDPFFTTKTEGEQKGMGLGLSISQSLVTAMGGRIDVHTQLGYGSTFSVLFPRHRVVADPPGQTHTTKEVMTHGY